MLYAIGKQLSVLAHTCLLTPVFFKNTAKQRIINLSPSKIIKLLYVGTFLWYVLTCTTTYIPSSSSQEFSNYMPICTDIKQTPFLDKVFQNKYSIQL